jgi:hypothetical protein
MLETMNFLGQSRLKAATQDMINAQHCTKSFQH